MGKVDDEAWSLGLMAGVIAWLLLDTVIGASFIALAVGWSIGNTKKNNKKKDE